MFVEAGVFQVTASQRSSMCDPVLWDTRYALPMTNKPFHPNLPIFFSNTRIAASFLNQVHLSHPNARTFSRSSTRSVYVDVKSIVREKAWYTISRKNGGYC